MEPWTRRKFLTGAARAAAGAAAAGTACAGGPAGLGQDRTGSEGRPLEVSLDGPWLFRTDPENRGQGEAWFAADASTAGWEEVAVPSTWQVSEKTAGYMGAAWYRRTFEAPAAWKGKVVRIEFEAVFHTAGVFVNGKGVGGHTGKGYTAFAIDITAGLEYGRHNTVVVRVDNSFTTAMLPRDNSYDWAPDGGITRPARLIVTSPFYLECIWVDAVPDPAGTAASLAVKALIRNSTSRPAKLDLGYSITDERSGLVARENASALAAEIPAETTREVGLPEIILRDARLWHFDRPNLYVLEASISRNKEALHRLSTTFGVRKIEVRGTEFLFNGEPVRLAGVERMAGSNPDFGMAEPASWIAHDHDDLKELNCVLTRVHWQQDRRVMDYCDRHGILIQVEVPTWGPGTFGKLGTGELEDITANGLAQLGEMIGRERNHPCVFSWGLCNEVDGQNPVAREFVRQMLREAKRLDPSRLRSYASNSLQTTPERDIAGEMDEWNEYYETWYGGDAATMRQNLEAVHRAFPDKPVVISEYGYCACTVDRPEDDVRRAEILRTHNAVFRDYPWVGGTIFFDYNDYRTHIGDKGIGVLEQRVHGVVDVFGLRKLSYDVLRSESSPIGSLEVGPDGAGFIVVAGVRKDLPAYTLLGYKLRWTVYGNGEIPLERGEALLPSLAPGAISETRFEPATRGARKILIEVVRPTGFVAASAVSRPRSPKG